MKIIAPPSKSVSHRAIICAFLAGSLDRVYPIYNSEDVQSTYQAMKKLKTELYPEINCNESASTFRFLKILTSALKINAKFICGDSLLKRPNLNFDLSGPGVFEVPGNISSQFVSGLLMSLPLLNEDSKIILTSNLESKPYVEMTIKVMNDFGVKVNREDYGFKIKGNQKYVSRDYRIEGDWSNASYFIAAKFLGKNIEVIGLNNESLQGDKICVELFKEILENDKETIIDAKDIPDLVPILSVVAAIADNKKTIITNASRLRFKESDRLKTITSELKKLGSNIKELNDGLEIYGVKKLKSGVVNSHNDHRIAMALSIASLKADGRVYILNKECVKKSYPEFFSILKKV